MLVIQTNTSLLHVLHDTNNERETCTTIPEKIYLKTDRKATRILKKNLNKIKISIKNYK